MEEDLFKKGLSDILKTERNKLELTQDQFSEIVDVEYKTYQSWELNQRSIKTHSFAKMIKKLKERSEVDSRFNSIIKALKEYIF